MLEEKREARPAGARDGGAGAGRRSPPELETAAWEQGERSPPELETAAREQGCVARRRSRQRDGGAGTGRAVAGQRGGGAAPGRRLGQTRRGWSSRLPAGVDLAAREDAWGRRWERMTTGAHLSLSPNQTSTTKNRMGWLHP